MSGDTPDWVHLPPGVEPLSLWESLHDGELVSVCSDLMARTVTLTFEVDYLNHFHNLGEGFRFVLRLGGVRSVRATGYSFWPGGYVRPENATREEQSRAVDEYQAKGREHSVDWTALEGTLEDSETVLDVYEAELTSADGLLTLRLVGALGGDDWHTLFLHAETLEFTASDGSPLTLDEFLALGRAYWDAFGARSTVPQVGAAS